MLWIWLPATGICVAAWALLREPAPAVAGPSESGPPVLVEPALRVESPGALPPGVPGEMDFSDTALSDEAWALPEMPKADFRALDQL